MANKMNQNKKRKDSKNSGKRVLLFVNVGLLSTLLFLYLFFAYFYSSHFFKNTVINGVDASNMTVKHLEDKINQQAKSYNLTLEGRNGFTEEIKGEDINLHAVFDGSIEELLNEQSSFGWLFSFMNPRELKLKTMLEYDEDILKKTFQDLDCFDKENVIEPVNAHVSDYGDNGYEIVPEDKGTLVKEDVLYKAIKSAIVSLEPTLLLEKAKCYEEPKIVSDHPQLVEAVEKMNKIASSNIIYEFGEEKEVVDGNLISDWLSVDDNFKVSLDTQGVKTFVDFIGKNYNSFGRVRTFKTSYGDVIKVSGGDYGWWLNRGKEVKELKKMILKGKQEVRKPAYFQTARQYGSDDIGDTYVEINLTAQHLFFYNDGKLILESDFVSGNILKNYGTPTGTYPIQYKENDATLVGEDYSTPVKYWMPFNGNIGLHDASWRHDFGKDIYLTRGSHGCINMPPAKAKKIFQHISRGVAVVVYELPGTENYVKEEDKSKDKTKATEDNDEEQEIVVD